MDLTCRLLVFSDIDGTLVDHHTYQWTPALPALDALHRLSACVVLASSKTAPEINMLRSEMGLSNCPAIVENGAGILSANDASPESTPQYNAIRAALSELPKETRRLFTGFGDMSVGDVVRATGLTQEAASLAKQRSFSEPGLWHGTPSQLAAFRDALTKKGVSCVEGGRFLTLSFGHDKAHQMRAIIDQVRPKHTIALGDAPNDLAMLQAADFGVIVANPERPPLPILPGEARGTILRTKQAGPSGWNTAILELLERLEMQKD